MPNVIENTVGWKFLNEPLYRWAIFFGAIMLIAWGWKGVLSFI